MLRKVLALAAAAVLTIAAAPPAKAPPAKPAAKPAAAAAFDARDPAGLSDVLAGLDARAEAVERRDDGVLLKVTSPAGAFQVQFAGCDAQGRACAALQFDATAERTATVSQINDFNQSSLTCRMFQDRAGKPHVLYSALLFAGDSRQEMLTHVGAWRGCLGEFGAFLKDPTGYLATAP